MTPFALPGWPGWSGAQAMSLDSNLYMTCTCTCMLFTRQATVACTQYSSLGHVCAVQNYCSACWRRAGLMYQDMYVIVSIDASTTGHTALRCAVRSTNKTTNTNLRFCQTICHLQVSTLVDMSTTNCNTMDLH